MSLSRVLAVFLRQFFLLKRSFVRFINIFTWIMIDILLWGFITRYLSDVGGSGFDFGAVFLGAVMLWGILSQMQRGFILASMEDIYTRNYLNLFSSPLKVSEYITGLILAALCTTGVAVLVVLITCFYIFGFSILTFGAYVLPFTLCLITFGITLGILASALVLRLGPAGEWLAWPIPAIISPFIGIFYPTSVLPGWMHSISLLLPPSYIFEGMRAVVLEGGVNMAHVWFGVALSFVYLFIMYRVFVYIYRYALRHGLIARFSAETTA